MNISKILQILPHRYPFLLVDRILKIEPSKSILVLKNVTMNEPFFTGHFPEQPIMPGVLILEALAQAAGLLANSTNPESIVPGKKIIYFAGIDNARFKRIVIPGDQLHLEAEVIKVRQEIWKFKTTATVEGQLACSAELMAAIKDI